MSLLRAVAGLVTQGSIAEDGMVRHLALMEVWKIRIDMAKEEVDLSRLKRREFIGY